MRPSIREDRSACCQRTVGGGGGGGGGKNSQEQGKICRPLELGQGLGKVRGTKATGSARHPPKASLTQHANTHTCTHFRRGSSRSQVNYRGGDAAVGRDTFHDTHTSQQGMSKVLRGTSQQVTHTHTRASGLSFKSLDFRSNKNISSWGSGRCRIEGKSENDKEIAVSFWVYYTREAKVRNSKRPSGFANFELFQERKYAWLVVIRKEELTKIKNRSFLRHRTRNVNLYDSVKASGHRAFETYRRRNKWNLWAGKESEGIS